MKVERLRAILERLNTLYDINQFNTSLTDRELQITEHFTKADGTTTQRVLCTVVLNERAEWEVVWLDFSLIEKKRYPQTVERFDLEVETDDDPAF